MKRLLPALLLIAACGGGNDPLVGTTTTSVPEEDFYSRQAQILSDDRIVELEDGVYIGYLQWVTTSGMRGGNEIQFDLAVWFRGEDAHHAIDEDGNGPLSGEEYYIRNVDPSQLVLDVSDGAAVTSVWYHYEDTGLEAREITYEQLAEVWENPPEDFEMVPNLRNSPWWIEIIDGEVVSINEQYIP